MRRTRFVSVALLALALVSMPVAARTTTLHSASEDTNECPDLSAEASGEQTGASSKTSASKPDATPMTSKSRPAARGNGTAPVRAPRWHRFIPGMFR